MAVKKNNVFLNVELKEVDRDTAENLAKKLVNEDKVLNIQYRSGLFGHVDKVFSK